MNFSSDYNHIVLKTILGSTDEKTHYYFKKHHCINSYKIRISSSSRKFKTLVFHSGDISELLTSRRNLVAELFGHVRGQYSAICAPKFNRLLT